ncbi:LTA synthase family protein [Limosilactobacillus antri]|uniref:LTA synthase family protein n=1 Tax=Limosilactobacillus antri TaxID=227943 RepID=UPI001F59D660|nr:LTA synthase family protein [Limosilactobacillus antri]
MQKLKSSLIWGVILFWLGGAQVYWNLAPHLAGYSTASLHTSAYLILKGITLVGPDLLVLLLGYYMGQCSRKESMVIKIWLNTVALGCLLSLSIALTDNGVGFYPTTIYNSMLPVLRNSYPLITGVMGGIVVSSIIPSGQANLRRRMTGLIWVVLAIPFFSPVNVWGWNDNFLALFYACLFILGGNLKPVKQFWRWGGLAIASLAVNVLFQGLMPFLSFNGSTINRFATVTNVLTVVTAYAVAGWLVNGMQKPRISYLLSVVVILMNSSAFAVLYKIADEKPVAHSTVRTAVLTLAAIVLALVAAALWQWLLNRRWTQTVSRRIDQFAAQDFAKQRVAVNKKLKELGPDLTVFAISYLIAAASMLLMNNSWRIQPNVGPDYNIISYAFTQRGLLLLLAALLIFTVIKFLQAISKRYWLSLAIVVVISCAFVIANREKIAARNEPILPSDLAMLRVAGSLFKMVAPALWLEVVTGLILLIGLVCWLEKKHPAELPFNGRRRLVYFLLAPLLFASCFFWNHSGTPLNNFLTSLGDQPMFYNQLSGARINGPLIQFMNNVDVKVMDQPAGYSRARMEQIVKKYRTQAGKINLHRQNDLVQQTVIFNLSESFSDPNRVPGVKLESTPIPAIKELQKNNTGGVMISSGYGGGTANMEYMTLTGYSISNFSPTLPVPYTQLVGKLKVNPSIVDSFNHAVAIHPYLGTFYNRTSVYQQFGFDKFFYLGSKNRIRHQSRIDNSPYLSDRTAYQNVLDQLKSYRHGQFINLVTMQNHFPYSDNYYRHLNRYRAVRVSAGTNPDEVDEFSTEIHYTDNAVKQFIKQIDGINRPITIVFYGDHLPGIYKNDMARDGVKLHETEYLIYSNKYARAHGAKNFKQNTAVVSPNDFIAMVAKQTNSKVNWYQALLTAVFEKLPAMAKDVEAKGDVNTARAVAHTDFVNDQGKLVKEGNLTKQQKQLLQDYRLVQYDVTAGKKYTLKYLK